MSASEWATLLTAIAAIITAWAEHRAAKHRTEVEDLRRTIGYLAERVAKLEGKAGV